MKLNLLLFFTLSLFFGCSSEPENPNVIIIITDDQGWGDVGIHGNKIIDTPNMDKLSNSGVNFERFFVSPVCAPTRASLLTGKYFLSTGVSGVTGGYEVMRSEEETIAEYLNDIGYATGCFGKWHNGSYYPHSPQGQGFEEFAGFKMGHFNNYFDPHLEVNGKMIKQRGYINDIFADHALNFIESNRSNPFFCYLAFNTPHTPFQLPDKYFNKYKNKGLDDELSSVYGMCENIDFNIGRIVDSLSVLEILDNTIIIFLGDNGPNTSRYNGNMRGRKASTHEGGVRVPGFISWEGHILKGKIEKQNVSHIDILPTLAEIIGFNINSEVDGVSINSLLFEETGKIKERSIYNHWSGKGAVRTSDYRYIVNNDGTQELYNMNNDPGENNNISDREPILLDKFNREYNEWYSRVTKNGIDLLPIPIGFDEAPIVKIEAVDAKLNGGLKYYEGHGWANDWITNWTSRNDTIVWNINNNTKTEYNVSLEYTCPKDQVGSVVAIAIGNKMLSRKILEPFDPPLIKRDDRVERKEVYEKEWQELELGSFFISEGNHTIRLAAKSIENKNVADIKSIILKKNN